MQTDCLGDLDGSKAPHDYRGGGTRTPDLRFWRPPLYQLSYAPRFATSVSAAFRLLASSRDRIFPPPRARGALPRASRSRSPGSRSPRRSRGPVGDPRRRGRDRGLDGRRWSSSFRALTDAEESPVRAVFSCRSRGRRHQALWQEYRKNGRPRASRPADPHLRAARQVRRRPPRQRPAGARRRGRPRLVRPARADRRDRAVRPRPRHQVRDVRDRAHQGRDHRRAARARLGAALGARPRARHRAGDRASSRRSCTARRPTRRSPRSSASPRTSSTRASPRSRAPRSPRSTSSGRSPRARATRSP